MDKYKAGHRDRMKDRLLNAKVGAVSDVDLLETLLFMALPRRDTKNLAKDLHTKYGSFAKVINAEEESLKKIKGIDKSALACFRLVKESVLCLAKEEFIDKPIISSWQSLLNYCRILIGHAKKEMFVVLYLNSQNVLIEEDIQDYGTVDQIMVYPREIAKRALFLNASSIILVHNHPGGSTKASKADIEMTNHIVKALSPFNIKIHDHVIVSDKGFYSFKSEGLL